MSAQLGSSNLAGLVNNAGVAVPGPLLHMPLQEYRRQLEVSPYETKDTFAIKSAQLVAHFIGLGLRPPYVGDGPVLFLRPEAPNAIRNDLVAIFFSLDLYSKLSISSARGVRPFAETFGWSVVRIALAAGISRGFVGTERHAFGR